MSTSEDRKPEIAETEEEGRRRQIERSLAQFDTLVAQMEPPAEVDEALFREFMRDIDAHRGERKLFADYLQ